MATVTGLTAERMAEIEGASIVDGNVVGGNLILVTHSGANINAGSVIGPVGPAGPTFVVCTSTTRPSTTTGKAIYETDTKLIRIWDGTRWKVQEKIVCTSTTRPAMVAGDEGTKIYETDTDLEYSWTGTSWLLANSYVAKYADSAARSSAWPSPPVGALSYLTNNPGILYIYENGVWNTVGDPPGTMSPSILTVAPVNHVLMYGQTLANAQTLYPLLWSLVDPIFKSGSSLLIPDMRSRVPVGKDNMGGVSSNRISTQGTAFHGINGVTLGSSGGSEWMQTHRHDLQMYSGYQTGISPASGPDSLILGGNHSGATTVDYSGNGGSQNMQPSIILNWILKVL